MKFIAIIGYLIIFHSPLVRCQSFGNEIIKYCIESKEKVPYNSQQSMFKFNIVNNIILNSNGKKYSGYVWLRLWDEEKIKSRTQDYIDKSYYSNKEKVKMAKLTTTVPKNKKRGIYKPWLNNKTIDKWIEEEIVTSLFNFSKDIFQLDSTNWSDGIDLNPKKLIDNISLKNAINDKYILGVINNFESKSYFYNAKSNYLELFSNQFIEEDGCFEKLFQCDDFLVEIVNGQVTGNVVFLNKYHQKLFACNNKDAQFSYSVYHPLFNTVLFVINRDKTSTKLNIYDNNKTYLEAEFIDKELVKFNLKSADGSMSKYYEKAEVNDILKIFEAGVLYTEISKNKVGQIASINIYESGTLERTMQFLKYPSDYTTAIYKDGKISKMEVYRDDKLHGKYIEFDDFGRIVQSGNFVDGIKDGIWTYIEYKENDYDEINLNSILSNNEIESKKEEIWSDGLLKN